MADTVENYLAYTAGFSRGDFDTGNDADLSKLQITYGQVSKGYDFNITASYLFLSDNFGDESGLGDIILRAGMPLNIANSNDFYGSIALKLPTADESKGLGTGESDIGGFLSYTQQFNEMNLTLSGGYIITGNSPTQSYEDIMVYGIGLSRHLNPWYVYGSLDGRQQILETGGNPLELSGGFVYQLKTTQFIKADGFTGLNNNSPDFGVAVGVVNWF